MNALRDLQSKLQHAVEASQKKIDENQSVPAKDLQAIHDARANVASLAEAAKVYQTAGDAVAAVYTQNLAPDVTEAVAKQARVLADAVTNPSTSISNPKQRLEQLELGTRNLSLTLPRNGQTSAEAMSEQVRQAIADSQKP